MKLSTLPAKHLTTLASLNRCLKSWASELLQRQDLVSAIRFACGKPRYLGLPANEISHTFRGLALAGLSSGVCLAGPLFGPLCHSLIARSDSAYPQPGVRVIHGLGLEQEFFGTCSPAARER